MLTKNEPMWLLQTLDDIDMNGEEVEVGQWQSQDISDKEEMVSVELPFQTLHWYIRDDLDWTQKFFQPNLPWAEDHFQERVSGQPLNPPPSEAYWPFARANNAEHKEVEGKKFSHTYPERFWPVYAGDRMTSNPLEGVRFRVGDLDDLVYQLRRNPLTRQAYLPIWFPEDTGAVQGQRVPCTLGYHFLFRPNTARDTLLGSIVYYIRSCDALRHLKDDAYMAARLLQWVVGKLQDNGITCASYQLTMHISSLHYFRGDVPFVRNLLEDWKEENYGYGV